MIINLNNCYLKSNGFNHATEYDCWGKPDFHLNSFVNL